MRLFVTLLLFILTITACKDKVICPAFQSTYILDDSVRLAYYSYLWKIDEAERTKYLTARNTSTDTSITAQLIPNTKTDYFAYAGQYIVPEREVKKTKYGIQKYEPYWLTNYRLKTAPMENVLTPEKILPPQKDTTSVDVGEFYATDFTDSLALDSTNVAQVELDTAEVEFELPTLARAAEPAKPQPTKYLYRYDPKDKMLNMEQEYYNKYFGEYLIQKSPPPKPEPVEEAPTEVDSLTVNSGQPNGLSATEGDSTSGAFIKPKKKKGRKNKKSEDDLIEGEEPEQAPVEEVPAEKPKVTPTEPEDDGF